MLRHLKHCHSLELEQFEKLRVSGPSSTDSLASTSALYVGASSSSSTSTIQSIIVEPVERKRKYKPDSIHKQETDNFKITIGNTNIPTRYVFLKKKKLLDKISGVKCMDVGHLGLTIRLHCYCAFCRRLLEITITCSIHSLRSKTTYLRKFNKPIA